MNLHHNNFSYNSELYIFFSINFSWLHIFFFYRLSCRKIDESSLKNHEISVERSDKLKLHFHLLYRLKFHALFFFSFSFWSSPSNQSAKKKWTSDVQHSFLQPRILHPFPGQDRTHFDPGRTPFIHAMIRPLAPHSIKFLNNQRIFPSAWTISLTGITSITQRDGNRRNQRRNPHRKWRETRRRCRTMSRNYPSRPLVALLLWNPKKFPLPRRTISYQMEVERGSDRARPSPAISWRVWSRSFTSRSTLADCSDWSSLDHWASRRGRSKCGGKIEGSNTGKRQPWARGMENSQPIRGCFYCRSLFPERSSGAPFNKIF